MKPAVRAVSALTAACTLWLAGPSAAWGQTFKSTEGNTYTGEGVDGGREGNCVWEIGIKRSVAVERDANNGRLAFTMDIQRRREAVFRGSNRVAESDCEPGTTHNSAVVRFYIDAETATSSRYSGAVIRSSGGGGGAFKQGDRITGNVEVFDGGRGLEFHNEEFMNGSAKVLAAAYRPPAAPEADYLVPSRAPDLVLSCKVIAADGGTSSSSANSSSHLSSPGGGGATRNNSSSAAVSTSACQAFGWERIRKTVSVWINEKRCDGYLCEVTPSFFKWRQSDLSRVSGQMRDACYTYECDRSTSGTRF